MLAIRPTGLLALFKKINIWYLKQRLGYSSPCRRAKTEEQQEDKGEAARRKDQGSQLKSAEGEGR